MMVLPQVRVGYDGTALAAVGDALTLDVRTLDDADVVAQAQRGSYDAFEELVRRYRNDVYSLCYRYVGRREEAWDLSQEVFIKAHRGLRRFRGEAGFRTWLLRIAANRCKDYFKKRRLKTVALDDVPVSAEPTAAELGPDRQIEARELGEAIERAVAALSEKHRIAFVLREYEGLSYQEMAEVMDCNLGTVMSRLHHARKNLQHMLTEMGVVEGTV